MINACETLQIPVIIIKEKISFQLAVNEIDEL